MEFGHVFAQENGLSFSFREIAVYRPVEDVSLLVIVPVLTAVSREHGMLDGENKGATGSEASAYLLANIRK